MAEKKAGNKASSSIRIVKCTCEHSDQDSRYGYHMRVMNQAPLKGAKNERYRCTVCSKEHNVSN